MKSIKEISWDVDEPTYRKDAALSYSMIASYAREGPSIIPKLRDSKSTPQLIFGSLVDTLLTNADKLDDEFCIDNISNPPAGVMNVLNHLQRIVGTESLLGNIQDSLIISCCDEVEYYLKRSNELRVQYVRESGEAYWNNLVLSKNKMFITQEDFDDGNRCASILKSDPLTAEYFLERRGPLIDNSIEIVNQLKFRGTYNNIDIRCMFDIIKVDHRRKIIELKDLKTTGKPEEQFNDSFWKWRYDIQSRMYTYIFKQNIMRDDYFKDFSIVGFDFIVINRKKLTPFIWKDPDYLSTQDSGKYKNWRVILEDMLWHIQNNVYNLSKEAFLNNRIMTIQ